MTGTRTIGIDIGTTALKGVVLDPDDGIIAQASRTNDLASPHPGWAEASPAQWRENVIAVLGELASVVGGASVRAIATSGMVPAMVAVDARGVPLRPAILQNDARAGTEVHQIAAEIGAIVGIDDALHATGSAVTQQSIAPTARWLAAHEPEVWRATSAVVGSYDWVLMLLGAASHVERNWAIESGLHRLDGGLYEPAVEAGALGDRLVPVRAPGTVVGSLTPEVAAVSGLSPGTPLVVGGADHVLSAYGAGLSTPGDWLIKLGGAGDILAVAAEPVADARFYLDEHPLDGLWLPNGCMATSGSLVRWVQRLLGIDDLAAMDAAAAERRAAEVLVLPYFLGEKTPINEPDRRGVIAGLHLGHDRVDLYRASLEGIAFGFRHNAEVLAERGVRLARATVTNGGATSMLWKRIHASVLGTSLATVRAHPGAALGAAMAAAVGIGAVEDWSAIDRFVIAGEPVEPYPDEMSRYDEAYALWRDLGDVTASTMRSLAQRG